MRALTPWLAGIVLAALLLPASSEAT